MTETEKLLAEARAICLRVHGAAPDELLVAVFQQRCTEHDWVQDETQTNEMLH